MVVARQSSFSPDSVDRILIGVCVVIWLAVIGVGVAATVVLVDLGTARHTGSDDGGGSQTPWLLYAVIAVSALIIAGAVPLLVRARRGEPARRPVAPARAGARSVAGRPPPMPGTEARTEKLRVGRMAGPSRGGARPYRVPAPPPRRLTGGAAEGIVDRMWLRATAVLVGTMGAAMLAVTLATYLMAVDNDGTAWTAYAAAAVITVVMPLVPWFYLRQLRSTIA